MSDDGKKSLYSGGTGGHAPGDADTTGPVKIDCARCGVTSEIGVINALKRLFRFSLWVPGRTYNRRLECPACNQRSWVRLHIA